MKVVLGGAPLGPASRARCRPPPVALTSGAPPVVAATCALAFAVAFVVATVSVRPVILCARKQAGPATRAVAAIVAAVGVAGLAV